MISFIQCILLYKSIYPNLCIYAVYSPNLKCIPTKYNPPAAS